MFECFCKALLLGIMRYFCKLFYQECVADSAVDFVSSSEVLQGCLYKVFWQQRHNVRFLETRHPSGDPERSHSLRKYSECASGFKANSFSLFVVQSFSEKVWKNIMIPVWWSLYLCTLLGDIEKIVPQRPGQPDIHAKIINDPIRWPAKYLRWIILPSMQHKGYRVEREKKQFLMRHWWSPLYSYRAKERFKNQQLETYLWKTELRWTAYYNKLC